MNLTEDQILTLAPDEPSKKSGKDLANPSKWITLGANEQAIWGECQGSGSKPYQAQVDHTNLAFKCSCPSRKFPCKHGIGLALLYARQATVFTNSDWPAWVAEWITRRGQKEEKKAEQKDKDPDDAALAKRQASREQRVTDGIEELLLWIKDIIRNGIIHVPEKNYAYWEGMAKRMIDAQCPGLAGMIKTLGNIPYFKEGWQTPFVDGMLNLYLIAKGYQNKESLQPLVLQDVRSWIGFTVSQDDLKQQQGLVDTWLVLGKQVSEDDNLTVERNWLYGINTNQYALILEFVVRGQGGALLLSPGMYVEAELVYYPSATPLRALIKRQISTSPKTPGNMFRKWKDIAEAETSTCSQFPVRYERAYAIKQVVPLQHKGGWWLRDTHNDLVAIKDGFGGLMKLLALSGGQAMDMVVLSKEHVYEPMGVWHNQTYKVI